MAAGQALLKAIAVAMDDKNNRTGEPADSGQKAPLRAKAINSSSFYVNQQNFRHISGIRPDLIDPARSITTSRPPGQRKPRYCSSTLAAPSSAKSVCQYWVTAGLFSRADALGAKGKIIMISGEPMA